MILVTGARGFVGSRLCQCLAGLGKSVRRTVRAADFARSEADDIMPVGDIGPHTDWRAALQGIEVVVHLAAHVHRLPGSENEAVDRYWQVNTLGTERLAQEAAKAGVKRFVYLSSIKVLGEQSDAVGDETGGRFSETWPCQPLDPYGISKAEAERRLWAIASATGMELVVIRPPLVYGPGVKANFERLLGMVKRGLPLPFASVRNGRSLIFLDNLVDFIVCVLHHPAAVGQTFLVADGEDLSTPELIQKIAGAMGRSVRLWPCPLPVLSWAGCLLGRSAEVRRLCGSLRLDSGMTREVLSWRPPYTVEQGIQVTVQWYLGQTDGADR